MTKAIEMHSIPTNIITGFLGVGKTSTILHLLNNKPEDERWAILVNEFGEIGIDGSLLEGQTSDEKVFIREVPGGCMCCASGVPMQVALNQLLTSAKPDRLLIEPTGLGHPKEVLEVLSSEHYQKVLSLRQTITLVDARKLSDERYTSHETFNQQIAIADTVIGNQSDHYNESDKTILIDYVRKASGGDTSVIFAEYGRISISELDENTGVILKQNDQDSVNIHHHDHEGVDASVDFLDEPLPKCGFIKAENQGEKMGGNFQSIGWRFSSAFIFDKTKLMAFIQSLTVDRLKAVFITDNGMIGLNLSDGCLTESVLKRVNESRIEIISSDLTKGLQEKLMECLSNNDEN